jgi:choline dehydrogenase-like flavoprotein
LPSFSQLAISLFMDNLDILIIGAGAAGAVLAARLSENPKIRVALIEAGRDTPPGAVPADISDSFPSSYANLDYFWPDLKATIRPGTPPRPYPQGRVMGGGSSVMGMWALRGMAADYDAWAKAGATGWSWSDVLPYFKKLERDVDYPNEDHGTDGPITVARIQPENWPGFSKILAEAAGRKQFRVLPDLNATEEDGIFAIPLTIDGNHRVSSPIAYLTEEVRRRPNLRIIAEAEVRNIAFQGKRAIGAHLRAPDGNVTLMRANEIVVSAGAIHSPALLLRSGIGPGKALAAAGVNVVSDLPGVGANLQNHFFVHFGTVVKPGARQSPAMRRYGMVGIRLSSGMPETPPADLFISFIARTGKSATGNRFGMLGPSLYAAFSRGSVTLDPDNAYGQPVIDFNALSDPRDAERILYAARMTRDLLQDEATRAITHESFIIPQNLPIRLFNKPGMTSQVVSTAAAAIVGMNGAARRAALHFMLGPGRLLSEIRTEDRFNELVLSSVLPMFHVAGTCAFGSVLDPEARVKGVEGLRVVDASVMPLLPRANTNFPTVMVAEKCAAHIAAGLRRK